MHKPNDTPGPGPRPSPAFQFYPSDFVMLSIDLSPAEAGALIRLTCHQWTRGGPLPDEPQRLAMIAGVAPDEFSRMWAGALGTKFERQNGAAWLQNIEDTRQEQAAYRALQSAKGKASAMARKVSAGKVAPIRGARS